MLIRAFSALVRPLNTSIRDPTVYSTADSTTAVSRSSDGEVNHDYAVQSDSDEDFEPTSHRSESDRPEAEGDRGHKWRNPTTADKGKGARKGRNVGKLALLLNMPLDVFFEITSRLAPLDILHLSRVSKQFRSTFASQNSRHIWVAARKNIVGLPDCPQDLSEPQYASLMFEHNCHACGKSHALKTDYSLRTRFCDPCFNKNVKKGSTILRSRRKIPEHVLTLLPRSLLQSNYVWSRSFEAKENGRSDYFYVSKIHMVAKRWRKVKNDYAALETFEKRQLAITSEIMNHATLLHNWAEASKKAKRDEDLRRSLNREASIKANLLELGYDQRTFQALWTIDGRSATLESHPPEGRRADC